MTILIGAVMILGFLFYIYIQIDTFRRKHNKVVTGVVFDAENMPSILDEAWHELTNDGNLG